MELQDRRLERWVAAGVIDGTTADRIRLFENERSRTRGHQVPIMLALGFGGLLVAAGILLFVSANWDQMSPAARTAVVFAMVGAFHVGGAMASGRFEPLAVTLHALGTCSLGAGIFLAGQIFNLDEHWPSGVMLWAFGAWVAWWLRRDWPQMALVAILTPAWLEAEWLAVDEYYVWGVSQPYVGLFLLALAYLTLNPGRLSRSSERAVSWVGAISLPCTAVVLAFNAAARFEAAGWRPRWPHAVPPATIAELWVFALGVPLVAAWLLGRRALWLNAAAAAWAVVLVNLHLLEYRVWMYPWLAIGCVGLALWGLREARTVLVNFATAGFALTILVFYFENVMSKMGRSVSLVGLGVLFLVGGYLLERLRRRMVGRLKGARS